MLAAPAAPSPAQHAGRLQPADAALLGSGPCCAPRHHPSAAGSGTARMRPCRRRLTRGRPGRRPAATWKKPTAAGQMATMHVGDVIVVTLTNIWMRLQGFLHTPLNRPEEPTSLSTRFDQVAKPLASRRRALQVASAACADALQMLTRRVMRWWFMSHCAGHPSCLCHCKNSSLCLRDCTLCRRAWHPPIACCPFCLGSQPGHTPVIWES